MLKDIETNEHPEQLEFLQLYVIEIGKFHKEWPEISTLLDRWVAFMTRGEELHTNALPATRQEDPAIAKAVAALERMGDDPELRRLYEEEEKARMASIETSYCLLRTKALNEALSRALNKVLRGVLWRAFSADSNICCFAK